MNVNNDTVAQRRQKAEALNNALPIPDYEPDLVYQNKGFSRLSKSGIAARPNHLGRGLKSDLSKRY